MAGVFTIYNCGTNFHKDSDDIVARLNKTTDSDHFINDGPGSGEFKPNFMGGRPDPTDWSPAVSWFGIVGGLAFGTGVEKNVERSMEKIKSLASPPSVINMCGWSRGGVTCLKIANELSKDPKLAGIKVNIFAIDPVPGTSLIGNDHMWTDIGLSPNVNKYMSIIAQHERRIEFTPVVPSNTGKRAWVDTMPGIHSSVAVEDPSGKPGPATIVRHLATRFLAKHGTKFSEMKTLDDHTIIRIYDGIGRGWSEFVRMGEDEGSLRVFGDTTRPVKNEHQTQTGTLLPRLAGFFVNNHHRETFKRVYPHVTAEINGLALDAFSPKRSSGWRPEMQTMSRLNPETRTTILRKFRAAGVKIKTR